MSLNDGTALAENGVLVQFIWYFKRGCLEGEEVGGMEWAVEV